MGRPPFDNPALVRSEKLSITLAPKEKRAIQRGARDRGETASTLTRQAILTDPAVVNHLVVDQDYLTLRLLARDWLNRTEQMVDYFGTYLTTRQTRAFATLIDELRAEVVAWDKALPLDDREQTPPEG